MKSAISLWCALGLLASFPCRAAEEEPRTWLENIGHDLAAPVLQPGRTYLITGSLLTVATLPLRQSALKLGVNKPLGSTSEWGYKLGFWHLNAAYILGYLAYGWIGKDDAGVRKSLLMLRATVYTGLVTTLMKEMHLEERPRKNGDFKSFPSGHASNAFAFSGVVYRNHGLVLGIPAFAVSSFVALSRMNDNAHYLNDVLFGATLGMSYAMGLDTTWSSEDESKSLTLVPILSSESQGIGAVLEF
jgi:hypothetical protein